nr:hypothetical protein [Candidatus Sigynarchaeota archaeon]
MQSRRMMLAGSFLYCEDIVSPGNQERSRLSRKLETEIASPGFARFTAPNRVLSKRCG